MTSNSPEIDSVPGETGLQYIAKVTASISHELKNVLAIINENNGLLEDLSFAAQRGKPLEPERLGRACSQMAKQINRADAILKNMNRFAHSFDHPLEPVDLSDLCRLVAALAERMAARHRVTLQVEEPAQPLTVRRHPFLLQNLLWQCLEIAISASSEGNTLTVKPIAESVVIEGLDGLEDLESLVADLPATVAGAGTRRQLTLHLA